MIKKIISSILLTGLAAPWVGAWGLHQDLVFQSRYLYSNNNLQAYIPYTQSPLYYMLQQGKSNFTVCVQEYNVGPTASRAKKPEDIQFELLERTFPVWVSQTRTLIEQSNRANEFADLLSWLPKKVTVTRGDCDQNSDIYLSIASTTHVSGAAMWYRAQKRLWKMNLTYGDSDIPTGLHESGHFFGLGDLTAHYDKTEYVYSHYNTTDQAYSLYAVGVIHQPQDSIMWWNKNESSLQTLSCDDVEGFINAVDFVQFMSGETSPRLENGWKSLCGRPYYYLRGRVASDETQLAALKLETEQKRLDQGLVVHLQQLLSQWTNYQENQIIPLLTQKSKELKEFKRPLNDEGLMLSAQIHHLNNVFSCAQDAIHIITDTHNHTKHSDQTLQEINQQIEQLPCKLGQDPFKTAGLELATPRIEDYPVGKTHSCAICGQQIALGEERYDGANFKQQNGKWITRGYFRHKTCSGITPQKIMAYHDHIEDVVAPTYIELLVRSDLAKSLRNAPTRRTLASNTQGQAMGFTPLSQPQLNVKMPTLSVSQLQRVNITQANTKPQPTPQAAAVTAVSASTGAVTPTENTATPSVLKDSTVGTVHAGESIHCEICGQEIGVGETYYKRTENHFMHRHNQCAYTFFARKHKVDESALASYTSPYWKEPQDIFAAKADMKTLGLSTADIRKYRSEEAEAKQKMNQMIFTPSAKEQARAQLEQECQLYRVITEQDVENFEQFYAKTLEKIAQKTAANKPLKKQEQQLLKQQEQLQKDLAKTKRCQALEKAASL